MLDTLLESKATRPRRTGGTLASTLVHAALIAGAIGVTTTETNARPGPVAEEVHAIFRPPPVAPPPRVHRPAPPAVSGPVAPRLPVVDRVPDEIPPIDVNVRMPVSSNEEVARGGTGPITESFGGPPGGLNGPSREGALDERYVDRAPRLFGSPVTPTFPMALRDRGIGGRVSIQFVVDTLGRAEMGSLRIVEATDSLFAQSVRAVLPRYRFTPGELGGRKVRTLVQLPFDFTLTR